MSVYFKWRSEDRKSTSGYGFGDTDITRLRTSTYVCRSTFDEISQCADEILLFLGVSDKQIAPILELYFR